MISFINKYEFLLELVHPLSLVQFNKIKIKVIL